MRTSWAHSILVLTCLMFASPVTVADRLPEGVSLSDWSGIRAAYEAGRHAAFAVDGGYHARNPGQQWRTHFDGRGFITKADSGNWSWGLALAGYGRGNAQHRASEPLCTDANGGRVEYQWDASLTEWYVNDTRGLEHGYTVKHPPESQCAESIDEPLQFLLSVRGDLRPRISGDERSVTFINEAGAAVVNYNGLKVVDADGAMVPAWFEESAPAACSLQPKGFSICVDDRGARYPLTIDPVAQQAYLKASTSDSGDVFGVSAALSGDTVVVGAIGEASNAIGVNGNQADNSASSSGAAYVFVRSGGLWSQQAYLKASNTGASDQFGYSVAVNGDTVIVGAPKESSIATGVNGNQADNSAVNSGAAYVFVRSGAVWGQQAYLKASNTGANDSFAFSVAASGDTVVVGAFQEDSSALGVNGNQADDSVMDAGAAYVFVRDGLGNWSQQAYLKASNTGANDYFARAVAASGDTIVVGALNEDSDATGVNGNQANNSATNSGAAYVFFRSGGVWSQQAYLKSSNSALSDNFGFSVAADGDMVLVGALGEDSNATGVNGNGADNSAINSGAAYVFVRSGGLWSQQAYLKASNTGANDQFGLSAAASGDTVVVGAYFEDSNATGVNGNDADNSASDSGAAYVFVRSGGDWSQQAYLKASNTDAGDNFGYSVAVGGDTVVVGARFERSNATGVNGNQADNSAPLSGAAYVIEGSDWDNDGVSNAMDVCQATLPALPVDATGRPLSDLNSDCKVNGLDMQAYVNNPGALSIEDFVADLLAP